MSEPAVTSPSPSPAPSLTAGAPPRPWWRYLLYAPVLLVPFALLQIPAVQHALFALIAEMRSGGARGVVLYFLGCMVSALFAAPIALNSALAGYAYGPVKGVLVASPASVLAASTAMLAGRLLARTVLRARTSKPSDPRIATLLDLVDAEGFRVTLLLRLTPVVPQNFLPFLLGATRLPVSHLALATWVGLFPITCLQVYAGSALESAAAVLRGDGGPQGPARWLSPIAGLVVSGVMVALIARTAKRTLSKVVAKREAEKRAAAAPEVPETAAP